MEKAFAQVLGLVEAGDADAVQSILNVTKLPAPALAELLRAAASNGDVATAKVRRRPRRPFSEMRAIPKSSRRAF